MDFKHGSLFAGIGGFDLASEWMGWNNIFHCENNPFCRNILNYYWPNADSLGDISKTCFKKYEGQINILSGGFPCQPYSLSGQRKGTNDPRHLWPEMFRAVCEIRPQWVVGENVRGIISWNEGLVFNQVQLDLENQGYSVLPFLLPACSVNAPHKRERVFFVAYSTSKQSKQLEFEQCNTGTQEQRQFGGNNCPLVSGDITYTGSSRRDENNRFRKSRLNDKKGKEYNWDTFPTQSPICTGNDGLSYGLDVKAYSRWRNKTLHGAGNAVVPQLVYKIFQAIELYESCTTNSPL